MKKGKCPKLNGNLKVVPEYHYYEKNSPTGKIINLFYVAGVVYYLVYMPYKDIEKRRKNARENARKNYPRNRLSKLSAHTKWRNKIKNQVISHYSNGTMECACCGEKIPEFLTVDHINNNGTAERKKFTGGGHHNYRYIIKNNFPDGYQILCFNCNCGRARTSDKICPHKREKNGIKKEE